MHTVRELLSRIQNRFIGLARKIRLYPRLIIMYFGFCMLPLSILFVIILMNINSSYEEQIRSNNQQTLGVFSVMSDNMLSDLNLSISAVATNRSTLRRVTNGVQVSAGVNSSYHDYLYNAFLSDKKILNVEVASKVQRLESTPYYLFDEIKENPYLQTSDSNSLQTWQLLDCRDRTLNSGPLSFLLHSDSQNPYCLLLSMPVKSALSGHVIGFIYYTVDRNIYRDLIRQMKKTNLISPGSEGVFSVVTQDGIVVYSSAYETGSRLDSQLLYFMLHDTDSYTQLKLNNNRQYVLSTPSAASGFIYLYTIPVGAFHAQQHMLFLYFIGFIMILSVSTIILLMFSHSITHPLSNLIRHMNLNERGFDKMLIEENPNARDELETVTHNYNRMLTEIGRLQEDLITEEHNKQQAEYDAVTSLINPHFLYNALDMINWQAYGAGEKSISESIRHLSDFFRILQKSGGPDYTLKDEIHLTECYCRIQTDKFQDRITFQFQIDPDTLPCKVINVILQPLIENAIYHGILTPDYPNGIITVTSSFNQGDLVLQVIDNGAGLQRSLEISSPESATRTISNYGVYSIQRRLNFAFGDQASLTYRQNHPHGVIAEIRIKQS